MVKVPKEGHVFNLKKQIRPALNMVPNSGMHSTIRSTHVQITRSSAGVANWATASFLTDNKKEKREMSTYYVV